MVQQITRNWDAQGIVANAIGTRTELAPIAEERVHANLEKLFKGFFNDGGSLDEGTVKRIAEEHYNSFIGRPLNELGSAEAQLEELRQRLKQPGLGGAAVRNENPPGSTAGKSSPGAEENPRRASAAQQPAAPSWAARQAQSAGRFAQAHFATDMAGIKRNFTNTTTLDKGLRITGVGVSLGVSYHFLKKAAKGTKVDPQSGLEVPMGFAQRTGNAILGLAGAAGALAAVTYKGKSR